MAMEIENYTGAADTFTFPNNPRVYDDTIDSNYGFTNMPYSRHHILISGGGIPPKSIVMTGHFNGASKNTNYQAFSKHITENHKLKKLYFDSDKFHLGVGKQIKKTHSGGRTNFIDYVATFQTVIGILLDDTQQTYTDGGAHLTNSGNMTTFIEEISGTITNGANPITITDNLGNQLTIPAASLTTGQSFVLTFIKMVDSGDGIYVTEYNYCEVNSAQIKTVQVTDGFGIIQLAASASTSSLTITNLDAGYTVKFRNGWSA